MKDYCDPKKYPGHTSNGWAMGGQNMCDVHLALKRLVALRFDGLLEKGVHDVMHFLGTSKLEWAVLLTDIQRAVRKYHNENFMITFDCASPFLASANGQIYTDIEIEDKKKWTYRMQPSADNKAYATDTRPFKDAVLDYKILDTFRDSPVSARWQMKDNHLLQTGIKNKMGNEGKTSWDSSVIHYKWHTMFGCTSQQCKKPNKAYDTGLNPKMLVEEKFDRVAFKDVVNAVFAQAVEMKQMS